MQFQAVRVSWYVPPKTSCTLLQLDTVAGHQEFLVIGTLSVASLLRPLHRPWSHLYALSHLLRYSQKVMLHVELCHSKKPLVVMHGDLCLHRFHGGLGWHVSWSHAHVVGHVAQFLVWNVRFRCRAQGGQSLT